MMDLECSLIACEMKEKLLPVGSPSCLGTLHLAGMEKKTQGDRLQMLQSPRNVLNALRVGCLPDWHWILFGSPPATQSSVAPLNQSRASSCCYL